MVRGNKPTIGKYLIYLIEVEDPKEEEQNKENKRNNTFCSAGESGKYILFGRRICHTPPPHHHPQWKINGAAQSHILKHNQEQICT